MLQALTDAGLAADIQAAYGGSRTAQRRICRWALPDIAWAGELPFWRRSPSRSQCAVSYYGGGIAPEWHVP